eukprot:884723_1
MEPRSLRTVKDVGEVMLEALGSVGQGDSTRSSLHLSLAHTCLQVLYQFTSALSDSLKFDFKSSVSTFWICVAMLRFGHAETHAVVLKILRRLLDHAVFFNHLKTFPDDYDPLKDKPEPPYDSSSDEHFWVCSYDWEG